MSRMSKKRRAEAHQRWLLQQRNAEIIRANKGRSLPRALRQSSPDLSWRSFKIDSNVTARY